MNQNKIKTSKSWIIHPTDTMEFVYHPYTFEKCLDKKGLWSQLCCPAMPLTRYFLQHKEDGTVVGGGYIYFIKTGASYFETTSTYSMSQKLTNRKRCWKVVREGSDVTELNNLFIVKMY